MYIKHCLNCHFAFPTDYNNTHMEGINVSGLRSLWCMAVQLESCVSSGGLPECRIDIKTIKHITNLSKDCCTLFSHCGIDSVCERIKTSQRLLKETPSFFLHGATNLTDCASKTNVIPSAPYKSRLNGYTLYAAIKVSEKQSVCREFRSFNLFSSIV